MLQLLRHDRHGKYIIKLNFLTVEDLPERRRSSRFSGNVFVNFQKIEKYALKKLAKSIGMVYNDKAVAEMAERSNAHDSKSCYGVTHTRVQIPFSAPDVNNANFGLDSEFALFFDSEYFDSLF